LHIGGLGLARCYLNRPDLTQTKFIPNPFCDEPQARLYKTGDLGRYLPDGNIEFLGRLDYQVKIRGFRIELGEIEATLTQHPHVREVLVIARDDRPGDKYLVAYVVPDKGQAPTINQLRAFLKQTLPEYMVPSAFVMLDSLPLTANGKIDRKALPLPESTTQEASKTFVAPTDELELQLTKIWEKVLGIRPIGVRDNFFDLGGHSLLAAQLSDQIEKALNKTMPLATIFQAPTVEQLAKILRQEGWSAPWSSVAAIQPGDTKSPLFLCQAVGLYYPLIPYLGPDQPIYALLAQVVEGQPAPPERVEDLAALYIKEMRSLQPEGPYFLGGLSFGGIIAYEMARQLAAQGQNVALLALFDSVLPGASRPLPIHTRAFVHTRNFLQLGPAYFLKQLKKKLQQLQETTMRIYGKFYVNRGLPVPHTLEYFAMREVNDEAVRNYVPQVYPGRVTLFKASNRADATTSYFDPELGWGKLAAGGLEIHDVPGDHLEILVEPNVRVLGEKLKACLDEALSVSDSELTHH
jgi:aspartate racemase